MNLKILNDECLLSETLRLVKCERELLTKILRHLREIERRRLFAGHSSLYDYATGALGYSADQAYRRIAAMRLLKDLPEIEEQIEAGEINLTHVGMAHSLFAQEKKNGTPLMMDAKRDVFAAMAGRSSREAQKVVHSFASAAPRVRESVRALGDGRNVVTIEISDETLAKLQQLKGLLAHKHPDLSIGELVDQLADIGLERLDPAREPKRKVKSDSVAAVRRKVWKRDGGACVICKSNYKVEEDHVFPEAMGGKYTFENIRLLCRECNLRAAVERYGVGKMDPYTSRTQH